MDIFVLGCPAEELRLLLVERVCTNVIRKSIADNVSELSLLISTEKDDTSRHVVDLGDI